MLTNKDNVIMQLEENLRAVQSQNVHLLGQVVGLARAMRLHLDQEWCREALELAGLDVCELRAVPVLTVGELNG